MKIGYTKKTIETKDRLFELMPDDLKHAKIFLNIGNANSKGAPGYLMLNKPENVKNAADKKAMFKVFKENRINSVKFIDLKGLGKFKAIGYLLTGKDLVLREQGLNVIGISQLFRFLKSKEWVTLKEEKVIEYRVIVFRDKILRAMIKLPNKKDFTLKQENCRFIDIKPEFINETIPKDVIKSVKCLGLDLAGVDCLINKKGEFKILEVNSGMSLCSKSIGLLFNELRRMKT